jgi:signal transduction histidine kinase
VGGATPSGANHPAYAGYASAASQGAWPLSPNFFAEALDAALALVHADGGELATLDDTRQRLVLRARRTRPHLDTQLSSFGGVGPLSRPRPPTSTGVLDPLAAIEQQSTDLLPGVLLSRTYRPGERLIGYTWQRGEPVIMSGEHCRALPGGNAPADPDTAWHLAVPILRPGGFTQPHAGRPLIGVIAVHNRDPLWSFNPRDIELLGLHADRVAYGMEATEMTRLHEGQAALLEVLRGASGPAPELPGIFPRVRDVVRQFIDAPSFALLLHDDRTDELTYVLAERDLVALEPGPVTVANMPRWWSVVRGGREVCISAPEDRQARLDLCVLGWGPDEPVQSLLAAPLTIGKSLIGAIVAGSPTPDAYDPEHARVFSSVARASAIVIEHARLADETRRSLQAARVKAAQLAVLNNAVLTLNSSLDLDLTLKALVRQAKGLTSAQVCAVLLVDEEHHALVGRASNTRVGAQSSGDTATREAYLWEGVPVPLDWRLIGERLFTEQYLFYDDLESDWRAASPFARQLAEEQVHAALLLPVIAHQGEPLGALMVYTPGQRRHFPTEEIGLLEGLAGQAAIAITNARLYQQLASAYERQQELDRYKDEFILTVSHEFRTPLTAIDGYVSLISRHGDHLPKEKLEQFAQEIQQATSQLASMVGMLVDANQMSDKPLSLTLAPVRIGAAAEQAFKQQPPEEQERVELQVPPDLRAAADHDRLRLVFSNLISNALKYSPEHARCTVSARLEARAALARAGRAHPAREGASEQWVVVSVADRGGGIPPDQQGRLFQKFVRLPHSLTTSVRGTGLGLWICAQYIEAMGGDIWVESALGTGSTFRFCLPALGAAPEAP